MKGIINTDVAVQGHTELLVSSPAKVNAPCDWLQINKGGSVLPSMGFRWQ